MQADPTFANSLGEGFRKIHANEGLKGFTLVSTESSIGQTLNLQSFAQQTPLLLLDADYMQGSDGLERKLYGSN